LQARDLSLLHLHRRDDHAEVAVHIDPVARRVTFKREDGSLFARR